ncbi:MAG TPA: histidine triad nucleotide-binding protein [Ignavibacteriaceae bacterium]|nr:histidine triad nucleotide-binding protein [Ignavibacteriaceae bacterium]
MSSTIFSKIISKEIPADIVYESEMLLAFKDIKPQAPVHILIIPKTEIDKVTDLKRFEHAGMLGEMFDAANKIAKKMGIEKDGFRLVFNCGNYGGQEVNHLHMHLLGGRQMNWPPG